MSDLVVEAGGNLMASTDCIHAVSEQFADEFVKQRAGASGPSS